MSFAATWNKATAYTSETIAPAIGSATKATLKAVDKGCYTVTAGTVNFLKEYPGIAMILSPSSAIKVVIANHVDDLMDKTNTKNGRRVVNQK